jgi:predicted DNA binding CopG/RHH family protein
MKEMELLEFFENDEWVSKANLEERKQELRQKYTQTGSSPRRRSDKKHEQGLSYNNLISNLLHQYVADKLVRQA